MTGVGAPDTTIACLSLDIGASTIEWVAVAVVGRRGERL
jgi:hypothetical protein